MLMTGRSQSEVRKNIWQNKILAFYSLAKWNVISLKDWKHVLLAIIIRQ